MSGGLFQASLGTVIARMFSLVCTGQKGCNYAALRLYRGIDIRPWRFEVECHLAITSEAA